MEHFSLPHDHGQRIEQEPMHMPKEEDFQTVSEVFKQLCDGSRGDLCRRLCVPAQDTET